MQINVVLCRSAGVHLCNLAGIADSSRSVKSPVTTIVSAKLTCTFIQSESQLLLQSVASKQRVRLQSRLYGLKFQTKKGASTREVLN